MRFSYLEITSQISRPIIPLIIRNHKAVILYSGLIDSGADYCVFSFEIAQQLGITATESNRIGFFGAGKERIEGFIGKINLRIGDKDYSEEVIFADISDFGHGILGHKGFFDHFDVNLKYRDQIIEIKNSS